MYILVLLKFTPLEFETNSFVNHDEDVKMLKFTPLEFETSWCVFYYWRRRCVKIYSVGV